MHARRTAIDSQLMQKRRPVNAVGSGVHRPKTNGRQSRDSKTMTDGRFVPPNGYLGPVNLTGPYDLPFSLAGQITAPLFRFDRSSPRIDRST
jgi:hypothetical protein